MLVCLPRFGFSAFWGSLSLSLSLKTTRLWCRSQHISSTYPQLVAVHVQTLLGEHVRPPITRIWLSLELGWWSGWKGNKQKSIVHLLPPEDFSHYILFFLLPCSPLQGCWLAAQQLTMALQWRYAQPVAVNPAFCSLIYAFALSIRLRLSPPL